MASAGECVIGVDIGTTGARAVAFDLGGHVLHVSSADYPLRTPRPGWAEQAPQEVFDATTASLKQTASWARHTGRHVAALGLSAILHSLVPMDAQGEPTAPSIIWADGRSVAEAGEIRAEADAQALYHRTGGPVHPMYLPSKLRWLRRHDPDAFARTATVAGIKEYVLRRWTGLRVCDRSVASGTGLYNLRTGAWDDEIMRLAGISATHLPPIVEPAEPLSVDAACLRALDLPEDCVLVPGAGDGVLQTIGTGCVAPGQMVAMVATSGAVRAVATEPHTDERARTWCYYLAEGRWVVGAAINNAGIVYAWLRDQLQAAARDAAGPGGSGAGAPGVGERGESASAPDGPQRAVPQVEVTAEDLDRWAAEVPAGSQGLLFLPYLAGERSPNWNAHARGLLAGLSLAHDYRHLSRATLEGVAYRMRTIFEPMEEVVGPAREIRAAGGFTRSPLWVQIVADVLGRPLLLSETPEASSLGAAQLALRGAGLVQRFDDLAPLAATGATVPPDASRHDLYSRLYELYQRLYDRLSPEFAAIARLQAELGDAAAAPSSSSRR